MKTLSYNTEKEIRNGIMIVVFATVIFTTFKIKELQLNDLKSTEALRAAHIEMATNNFAAFPVADAKLIEEPAKAFETPTDSKVVSGNEIAVQMKTWMTTNSYWNDEEAANEQELVLQMTNNLRNGTYFKDEIDYENQSDATSEVTRLITSSLRNGKYFSDKTDAEVPASNQPELATQLKLSLASGNFWSGEKN